MELPLADLVAVLGEKVVAPDDPRYPDASTGYGGSSSPAAVVLATSEDDVVAALAWAARTRTPVAARSGGHSHADARGLLLIDLAGLADIAIDGDLVTVGPGVHWGDVASALSVHGLAISSGDTESVGVGGLTLGGGIGWLVRRHGLALDALLSCRIATADGALRTTSAQEETELFWSVRGGAGATGIVTSLTFRAAPLEGVVTGTLTFAREGAASVIRTWRDVHRASDERLNSTLFVMPPFGEDLPASVQVMVCFEGTDVDEARGALGRLLTHPDLIEEQLAPGTYRELLGEAHPPQGVVFLDGTGMMPDLDDVTIDALIEHSVRTRDGMIMLRYVAGALNRVAVDATAFAHRDAEVMLITVSFLPPETTAAELAELGREWDALLPSAPSAYVNFLNAHGPEHTARAWPGETLTRLRAAKRTYDPEGLIRTAHALD